MNRPRLLAIVQALAVVGLAALAGVLGKKVMAEVPAFTFTWVHVAIGGAVLTVWSLGVRRETLPRGLGWRIWLWVAFIGLCNLSVVRLMLMLALARVPATTHVYLVNYVGLVTMAMSVFLLRERPTGIQVLGAVVALAGLRLYFQELPAPEEWVGLVYLAVAVFTLALTNNLARKVLRDSAGALTAGHLSLVGLWVGGLPLVLVGLAVDWPPRVGGWGNWSVVAFSGIAVIAIGLTLWNHILRTLQSFEASVLGSSGVVWVAILAAPLLGERLEAAQIFAIALLLVGLALSQVRR